MVQLDNVQIKIKAFLDMLRYVVDSACHLLIFVDNTGYKSIFLDPGHAILVECMFLHTLAALGVFSILQLHLNSIT